MHEATISDLWIYNVMIANKTGLDAESKFVCFVKGRSEEKTWDVEKAQDLLANLTANPIQEVRLGAPPALEPRGGA